jgi:hypothetical protein
MPHRGDRFGLLRKSAIVLNIGVTDLRSAGRPAQPITGLLSELITRFRCTHGGPAVGLSVSEARISSRSPRNSLSRFSRLPFSRRVSSYLISMIPRIGSLVERSGSGVMKT